MNGNKMWEKEFVKDTFQYFIHLKQVDAGLSLAIKSVNTNLFDDPARNVAFWKLTLDHSGNIIDEKGSADFNASNRTIHAYSTRPTPDNGFLRFVNEGELNTVRLIRVSPEYKITWDKVYSETRNQYVTDALVTPARDYAISMYNAYVFNGTSSPAALP